MAESRPRQRHRPTGSSSKAPLTKYYRSGGGEAAEKSPFAARPAKKLRRGRKFLLGGLDFLVILAVIFVLVYSLLINDKPKIAAVQNPYRTTSAYQQAAAEQLSKLKNKTKFTLDDQGLVDALQKQFPEISSANIELPLFSQTPVVHLDISQPIFYLSNQDNIYVIDANGTAVGLAKDLPGVKKLPTVIDQTGFEVRAGQQVLSSGAVTFINELLAQATSSKVPIKSLTLPRQAQEIDLRTKDKPYYVKFFLGGAADQQIGQFLAARQKLKGASAPSQYLDVRVSGKIFYK